MTSFDKIYTTMLRIVSKNRQKSPEMKRFGIKNCFIRVCESTNEIVKKTDLFQPSYAQMIESISAQMIEVSPA